LQSITTILPFILLIRYFQSFSFIDNFVLPLLANNTEIIAILGSGISFTRFFKTLYNRCFYHISFVLLMGFYVVPVSSEGFNFRYTYLRTGGKEQM
jgi:hypothetical protein